MHDAQLLVIPAGAPHIGDAIELEQDVLAELARASAALPQTWRFLPAGTRGRLLGWRERAAEPSRAVVDVENELAGSAHRMVVLVGEGHVRLASGRANA
jgi:hypothetical protein